MLAGKSHYSCVLGGCGWEFPRTLSVLKEQHSLPHTDGPRLGSQSQAKQSHLRRSNFSQQFPRTLSGMKEQHSLPETFEMKKSFT